MKHPARIKAEKAYAKAVAAWRKAENGTSEDKYFDAELAMVQARDLLVKEEMAHPTQAETAKRSRRLELSSRGLE